MPAPKNIRSETPGEAPPQEPEPAAAEPEVEQPDAESDEPVALPAPGTGPETPDVLAAKDAELKRQVAATKSLVGSGAALNWDHLNSAAAVQKDYTPSGPELPDQADIDPDTISAPVLSKQGWVLPTNDPRARIGAR